MAKELGDVLWYVAQLASELGLDLDEIAQANLDKLLSRQQRGRPLWRRRRPLTFAPWPTQRQPAKRFGEALRKPRAGTSALTLTPSGVSWRAISPATSCSSARLPPFA